MTHPIPRAAGGALLALHLALFSALPAGAQTQPADPADTAGRADTLRWSASARVQADHGRFDGVLTRDGRAASATYLRRATGSIGLRWHRDWRAGLTLDLDEDGRVALDLAAVSWAPREGLQLAVGRIDPDFGLDNAISSSHSFGIERSALWDLVPGVADSLEGAGLRADAHGDGWHASAGLYDQRERHAAIGRAVWMADAPVGRVQLGASLALTRDAQDDGRVRTRLGVRGVTEDERGRRSTLVPAVAAPGFYDGERAVALEATWQGGPWLASAEWLTRRLDAAQGAPARSASGWSVATVWSPSGHARRHDERRARFGAPRGVGAGGAWELLLRWDQLGVDGARSASVLTAGATWFAEDTWRVSLNWVQARSDDDNAVGDTRGRGLVLRAQAVF